MGFAGLEGFGDCIAWSARAGVVDWEQRRRGAKAPVNALKRHREIEREV